MMKSARLLCPVAVLAFVALFAGGCSYSAHAIRSNYTNNLDSTAQNDNQDRNTYARTIDHNTRSAWDDTARLFLLDKPSRLSPYIIH